MIPVIETFRCEGPLGNVEFLNINQILISRDNEGYWPVKIEDLVKILAVMTQRICDRSDQIYAPFIQRAWNMLAQASKIQAGSAMPRAVVGNYVTLIRVFNTLEDVVHDGAMEILLGLFSALVEDYVKALTTINQHNLHSTIAAKRKKATHEAA